MINMTAVYQMNSVEGKMAFGTLRAIVFCLAVFPMFVAAHASYAQSTPELPTQCDRILFPDSSQPDGIGTGLGVRNIDNWREELASCKTTQTIFVIPYQGVVSTTVIEGQPKVGADYAKPCPKCECGCFDGFCCNIGSIPKYPRK